MLTIVVLISGGGSNLQAIIDCAKDIGIDIQAVISNQHDAYGLKRAQLAGIQTHIISHHQLSREQFDCQLKECIDDYSPDLVVLAGFMRILGAEFVAYYHGKLINIHPSLLPKFTGLNTHQRAIDAGENQHGVSVHFVTQDLDLGPVIAQASVNITQNDSAQTLAKKVLKQEHKLYPKVLSDFAHHRIKLVNNRVIIKQ